MNKTTSLLFLFLCAFFSIGYGQTRYTLDRVIDMAKAQSPLAKQAETQKENRYWNYRFYKSNYNPQLRLSGVLPNFNRTTQAVVQPEGDIDYKQIDQTTTSTRLYLNQPIPWTGGNIFMNSNLDYFKDNADQIERWRGDPFNIQINQPILAFNQLRWDKKTEPLRFEESKRSYVEDMEAISRDAVERYFNVMDAQIRLQIAEFNLANNDTIYKIENGRYNIGTTTRDKLLQAELQLLRSRQAVTQEKINLQNTKLAFRSYLGIKENTDFELTLPEVIPNFTISVDEALNYARANRADFIAFERRKVEAERGVAEAKGQRYAIDVTATYGLSNTGAYLNDVYVDPLSQQTVNLQFNIPIVDWGRNKARVQRAIANKRLNDYIIEQDQIIFEQEIITQVRQFDVLLSQIEITKKSDEVAQERYTVSQNRYLIGKIDITNLNIALTEKDQAKQSYLNALRAFWNAYYDMRRLTLYDFSTGQLLYTVDD
ncbi:MAG: TolC family protein [Bacteroidia bacterium]|nr:TolC family protein [Bacteroidia bacterium]